MGRRFGEPREVIDAIANHHDLDRAETLYPIIVNAADAISAARPGARRETLESYIKRLEGLESIATSFPGVENAFAIQAGREIASSSSPTRSTTPRLYCWRETSPTASSRTWSIPARSGDCRARIEGGRVRAMRPQRARSRTSNQA